VFVEVSNQEARMANSAFNQHLLEEIIPSVLEKTNFVATEYYIGGFSLGGLAALYAAYEFPKKFSGVFACSPTPWSNKDGVPLPELFSLVSETPKLFYIDIGNLEDSLQKFHCNLPQSLLLHAKVEFSITPGGHDIIQWRDSTRKALPFFFNNKQQ